MHGHFVVCGLGQVGYGVASLLLDLGESVAIVALDARDEWVREVVGRGATVIKGDACDSECLRKADPESARAVLAVTSSDSVNLEIALDVKRMRPGPLVIARIFDQTLARQAEASLGVDRALAMSVEASPEIASAALGERIVNEFHHEGKSWSVFRQVISDNHEWAGQTIEELEDAYGFAVLLHVCNDGQLQSSVSGTRKLAAGDTVKVLARADHPAFELPSSGNTFTLPTQWSAAHPFRSFEFLRKVWRGSSRELRGVFIALNTLILISIVVFQWGLGLSLVDATYYVITTVTTTGYGDITPRNSETWLKLYCCLVMVLGSASSAVFYSIITAYIITSRLQEFTSSHPVPEGNHVVIMGLGDVGYRVAQRLLAAGSEIVIIDSTPDAKYLRTVRKRAPVVVGDARERDTLVQANIRSARAFLALTGVDAINLSAGLLAKELNPDLRMVLRIFDGAFAEKIQSRLSIDLAMIPPRLAAPAFVGAALRSQSLTSFVLRGHFFSISAIDDAVAESNRRIVKVAPDATFAIDMRELTDRS